MKYSEREIFLLAINVEVLTNDNCVVENYLLSAEFRPLTFSANNSAVPDGRRHGRFPEMDSFKSWMAVDHKWLWK
jgi:hypothetical protein